MHYLERHRSRLKRKKIFKCTHDANSESRGETKRLFSPIPGCDADAAYLGYQTRPVPPQPGRPTANVQSSQCRHRGSTEGSNKATLTLFTSKDLSVSTRFRLCSRIYENKERSDSFESKNIKPHMAWRNFIVGSRSYEVVATARWWGNNVKHKNWEIHSMQSLEKHRVLERGEYSGLRWTNARHEK